jgi:ribonuclease III
MTNNLNFAELEHRLGYVFQNRLWLEQALVHSSYAYECPEKGPSNERLEFLGDAVLNLIISDFLVARNPAAPEGELSRHRASLVNARYLAGLSRRLDLGAYLLLGKGEERQAGRRKPSMLADALEALVAAVYLDGGYESAKAVVKALFQGSFDLQKEDLVSRDYKTTLQEYVQKWQKVSPEYHMVRESGPAHDRVFAVEVCIAGKSFGRGKGKTKKQASQEAARQALLALQQPSGSST